MQINRDVVFPEWETPSTHIELLGTGASLNVFTTTNSSPRVAMDISHLGQVLTLTNADKNRVYSGVEHEYGKYTFNVEVPMGVGDVKVLDIIQKYPKSAGNLNFKKNSETLIIYESMKTRELGVLEVPNFHLNHKEAGFHYVHTDVFKNLRVGDYLQEGTILAHSPQVKVEYVNNEQVVTDWHFGNDAMTIMGSFPWVVEDGLAVTESFCKRSQSMGFGSRVVEWGREVFPLNLYGDENTYKPFPDIGERIRDDGLVFALRRFKPGTYAATMSKQQLMTPDYTFDELYFGKPNAIVENVEVWHSHVTDHHRTPTGMEEQAYRYWMSDQRYGERIESFYAKQKARFRGEVPLTPPLHNRIVTSQLNNTNIVKNLPRTFRKEKLDDWRVKITYSYPLLTTLGSKLSDLSAAKGVICKVIPDEDAPVDKFGNRADVVTAAMSTANRMNIGRLFAHHLNGLSMQMTRYIRTLPNTEETFNILMEYYKDVSPLMYESIIGEFEALKESNYQDYLDTIYYHLDEVRAKGIYIFLPPNTPGLGSSRLKYINMKYPLDVGPVTFKGEDGRMVTTKGNFLIAPLYIIRLDKTANDWCATTFPKRQHHGITAKLSKTDKYSNNYRNQAVRIFGETEIRLISSKVSPGFLAAMTTYPNNPAMCNKATETILTADKPTNIKTLMDYEHYVKQESRALQYIKEMLRCYGVEFAYVDETKYSECFIRDKKIWCRDELGNEQEVTLKYEV